ncbi:MAG: TlpA family protein disulfide reductase [Gammaproteobacteria bacterium]|nr:TlpA family protein disulfide reductase [Gammaproteobacteria bacterium]
MTRVRADRHGETMIVRLRGRLLARSMAILLAAAVAAMLLQAAFASNPDGALAPDFALKGTDGKNLRLSEYRSEVVALAFWASWCGKCREQLPELERLQQALGPQGLRVLSVSFDETHATAAGTAAAAGVSFPVLLDSSGEVGRLYDVGRLPLVVLVDRAGRVRAAETDRPAPDEEIRALLAE